MIINRSIEQLITVVLLRSLNLIVDGDDPPIIVFLLLISFCFLVVVNDHKSFIDHRVRSSETISRPAATQSATSAANSRPERMGEGMHGNPRVYDDS